MPRWDPERSDLGRFWSRVGMTGGDACWEWLDRRFNFHAQGRGRSPRAVMAGLLLPESQGMSLRMRCGNSSCVRPDHIEVNGGRQIARQIQFEAAILGDEDVAMRWGLAVDTVRSIRP